MSLDRPGRRTMRRFPFCVSEIPDKSGPRCERERHAEKSTGFLITAGRTTCAGRFRSFFSGNYQMATVSSFHVRSDTFCAGFSELIPNWPEVLSFSGKVIFMIILFGIGFYCRVRPVVAAESCTHEYKFYNTYEGYAIWNSRALVLLTIAVNGTKHMWCCIVVFLQGSKMQHERLTAICFWTIAECWFIDRHFSNI